MRHVSKGKKTTANFPLCNLGSSFELIHFDIWGF